MRCFYRYDEDFGLYAVTIVDTDADEWVLVVDETEFDSLAGWAWAALGRPALEELDAPTVYALLAVVIGRDHSH